MTSQLVARGKATGDVYRVYREGDKLCEHLLSRRPLTEYVNSIQLYNDTSVNTAQYEQYFERDPFTKKQNEVIKVLEKHHKVQKEYSILKDLKTTAYIKAFLYRLIMPQYKNGKKDFPLLDWFDLCSKEQEIRPVYESISTAEPLHNPVDFKELGLNKWDRVNWLKEHKIINVEF